MTAVAINRPALEASMNRLRTALQSRPEKVYRALRPTLTNWGTDWQRRMTARFKGTPLKSRTTKLEASMRSKLSGSDLATLRLRLESVGQPAYANIHEFGGEIRPKNAKFLTIPTEFNKKASGATDFASARALISAHPDDTFFLPYQSSSGPALLLMWRKGHKDSRKVFARARKFSDRRSGGVQDDAVPMFRLVRKVDMPGPNSVKRKGPSRLGFHDSWNEGKAERARDLVSLKVGP